MGSFTKGGAASGLIAWPSPIKHKILANYSTNVNNANNMATIPDLTAADGTVWAIDFTAASAASIQRLGPTGSILYTVIPGDVNASASALLAVLVDYVDGKLYTLWSGASGNVPYFASTPLATKTLSVVALTTTFTGGLQKPFLDRVGGQGTGNLTIYSQNFAGPALEKRDINTAGTLQGATAAVTFGGVTPAVSLGSSIYVSQAANLNAELSNVNTSPTPGTALFRISRGGSFGVLSTIATNRPVILGSSSYVNFSINGNNVTVMYGAFSAPNSPTSIIKSILRSDFDAFLNQIADNVGCL